MSRNRCSTTCQCNFWSFNPDREVPINDKSLMTQAEYLKTIGWADCPYKSKIGDDGYNYQNDLSGAHFGNWRSPDGKSWSNGPHEGLVRVEDTVYSSISLDKRYRYRKIVCPICRSRFVGWYVQQPKPIHDAPYYELYDTSFWNAYNDEPSDEDRVGVIEWTDDLVVKAIREYVEKHPEILGKR